MGIVFGWECGSCGRCPVVLRGADLSSAFLAQKPNPWLASACIPPSQGDGARISVAQGQLAAWHAYQWPTFVSLCLPVHAPCLLGHCGNSPGVGSVPRPEHLLVCPFLGLGCVSLSIPVQAQGSVCAHVRVARGPGQDSSVGTQQTGGPMVGGGQGELVSGGAPLAFLGPGCRDLPALGFTPGGGW